MAEEATMNTLKKMDIDEMIAGKRCLVVYGNKPGDIEEAEVIDIRPRKTNAPQGWVSPYRVLVRFADGVEYDYHPSQIMEVK
jgi:hypothetical protein